MEHIIGECSQCGQPITMDYQENGMELQWYCLCEDAKVVAISTEEE